MSLLVAFPVCALAVFIVPLFGSDIDRLGLFLTSLASFTLGYAVCYLAWTWLAFRRFSGSALRRVTRRSTPVSSRSRMLMVALGADGVSFPIYVTVGGLVGVLGIVVFPVGRDPLVIGGTFLFVAGAWLLMVSAFAVTYMRSWASDGGLEIPGEGPERFADFFYVAVQVATTFATSDVETRTTRARNWVTLNSILAFAFNSVIIALFLSIATR